MIIGKAITAGGSGGIPCTLTVATAEGALVEAALGSKKVSATAGADGTAILVLEKEGLWTITATLDGETKSTEILVEHNIEEELAFVDPILQNNTWEEISKVARSGKASQIWNVGDTKPVVCGSKTYTAQIVDFDHYEVEDPANYGREKAGIVFQFVEASAETYSLSLYFEEYEASNKVIDKLECKDYVPTIKYPSLHSNTSSNDPSKIYTDTAKDIFPSEREIFGTAGTNEKTPVGTQFAFYVAGNSKIKKDLGGTAVDWWTRSFGRYSNYRVYVSKTGESSTVVANSTSKKIAPVFCI